MDAQVLAADDVTATFGEIIGGRVAVIDFWATWCGGCRVSLPKVNELAASYSEADLTVIGINVGEDRETALDFALDLELDFTIYLDPELAAPPRFAISSLPAFLVVDRDGTIVYRGRTITDEARAIIRRLIGH
jgi:thiol-disulfide isomerase/thioredoxin